MNNLIVQSLLAHRNYMYFKIYDRKKALEFWKEMNYWIDFYETPDDINITTRTNTYGGQILALDIKKQICDNIKNKFESGRSINYWIERLA
jgi:hypothetical protein